MFRDGDFLEKTRILCIIFFGTPGTTNSFFIKTKKNPPYNITPYTINFFQLYTILFLTILQNYTLLPKTLTDCNWNLLISFRPYNFTHYNMKILSSYFQTLQYYKLQQDFFSSKLIEFLPYNITPYTIKFFYFTQNYFWQSYNITDYSQNC